MQEWFTKSNCCKCIVEHWSYLGFLVKKQKLSAVLKVWNPTIYNSQLYPMDLRSALYSMTTCLVPLQFFIVAKVEFFHQGFLIGTNCFASLLIGSHSRQTKGDAKPVPDVGHLAHPLHLLLHLPPHLSLVLVRHSRNKRIDSDTGDASPREYWRNAKKSHFSHFCRIWSYVFYI